MTPCEGCTLYPRARHAVVISCVINKTFISMRRVRTHTYRRRFFPPARAGRAAAPRPARAAPRRARPALMVMPALHYTGGGGGKNRSSDACSDDQRLEFIFVF